MTYEERLEKLKNGKLTTGEGTTHDMFRFIRDKQIRNFIDTDKKIRYQVWMIPTSQFDPSARIENKEYKFIAEIVETY